MTRRLTAAVAVIIELEKADCRLEIQGSRVPPPLQVPFWTVLHYNPRHEPEIHIYTHEWTGSIRTGTFARIGEEDRLLLLLLRLFASFRDALLFMDGIVTLDVGKVAGRTDDDSAPFDRWLL